MEPKPLTGQPAVTYEETGGLVTSITKAAHNGDPQITIQLGRLPDGTSLGWSKCVSIGEKLAFVPERLLVEIVESNGRVVVIDATTDDHGVPLPRSVSIRRKKDKPLDLPRDCGEGVQQRWLETALTVFANMNNAVMASADSITITDDERDVSLDAADLLRYVRSRSRPGRPEPDEWKVKEALRLRNGGLTYRAIAESLTAQVGEDVSKSSVERWIKKYGEVAR